MNRRVLGVSTKCIPNLTERPLKSLPKSRLYSRNTIELNKKPRWQKKREKEVDQHNVLESLQPMVMQTPGSSGFNKLTHNDAVRTLWQGISYKDVQRAWTEGWLPVSQSGNADILPMKTLQTLLHLAGNELTAKNPRVNWEDVKILASYLLNKGMFASTPMDVFSLFLWKQLQTPEGVQRVLEIVPLICAGSIDHSSVSKVPKFSPLPESTLRLSPNTSAAYITALSMANPSQNFKSLLPKILNPSQSSTPVLLLSPPYALSKYYYPIDLDPQVAEKAQKWMEQTSFAYLWFTANSPGFAVLSKLDKDVRRSDKSLIGKLWKITKDAITGDISWISSEAWAKSASHRWLPGRGIDEEANPEGDETSLLDEKSPEVINHYKWYTPPSTQAHILQAHIAGFLIAALAIKDVELAGDIWGTFTKPPYKPGIVLWTGLLEGYARNGHYNSFLSTWKAMNNEIKPDVWAYIAYISASLRSKDINTSNQVIQQLRASPEFEEQANNNLQVYSQIIRRIVSELLEAGEFGSANLLLKEMNEKKLPHRPETLNVLLKHYVRRTGVDYDGVRRVLDMFKKHNVQWTRFTYTLLLQAFISTGKSEDIEKVIILMKEANVKPSRTTYGTMIHFLASLGTLEGLENARSLLDELIREKLKPNEIIYTSLIQGYIRASTLHPSDESPPPLLVKALSYREVMKDQHIPMNRIGYNSLIAACMNLQTEWGTTQALGLFEEMEKQIRDKSEGKSGVSRQDSWIILIQGFAAMGNWDMAQQIVHRMRKRGVNPQSTSSQRIIETVRRRGFSQETTRW